MIASPVGTILVGTCNWSDFERFYPRGLKPNERLGYYSRYFSMVEIDSTFYALMPPSNFELWAARTPDDFKFDVKAFRTLTRHGAAYQPDATHEGESRSLDPTEQEILSFKESIEPLRAAGKLRALLFQFPPWMKESPRNREYLEQVREYFPHDLVSVEFRHRSWLDPGVRADTFKQLRDLGMAYVVVDQPQLGSGSIPSIVEVTSPKLATVRFHGRNYQTWYKKGAKSSTERFNYLYSPDELATWIPKIREMAAETEEVHLLMNNNRGNYAIVNARDAMKLLGQPVLPLDIEPYPTPDAGAAREPHPDLPQRLL